MNDPAPKRKDEHSISGYLWLALIYTALTALIWYNGQHGLEWDREYCETNRLAIETIQDCVDRVEREEEHSVRSEAP